MKLDDTIIQEYLSGKGPESYDSHWVFDSDTENGRLFEAPNSQNRAWVSQVYEKVSRQLKIFEPYNANLIRELFPDFDKIENECSVYLIVGFPAPYDAKVLRHQGKEHIILDLIRLGAYYAADEDFSCCGLLTHELIHMCVHEKYPPPDNEASYLDKLNYIAFDEGFAHALAWGEDIAALDFDPFLQGKYDAARKQLSLAVAELDKDKRAGFLMSANAGNYWGKFAAICGKLFIIKNKEEIKSYYDSGWNGFIDKILNGF